MLKELVGVEPERSGDAETQLSLLKEILTDVFEIAEIDVHKAIKKSIISIKNLMSDCCATQKKFNELLINFLKSLLPELIDNWENLSPDVLMSMNFFGGLHFIVGLADQAEACLKVW